MRSSPRPSRFGRPKAVELLGSSPAITRVEELVRRAAALDGSVLLTARRGADAESVARDIHARSPRSAQPFVGVSCGAAAVERALFGEPLAQAPADLEALAADSRIAAARGGTLFLEDVSELRRACRRGSRVWCATARRGSKASRCRRPCASS